MQQYDKIFYKTFIELAGEKIEIKENKFNDEALEKHRSHIIRAIEFFKCRLFNQPPYYRQAHIHHTSTLIGPHCHLLQIFRHVFHPSGVDFNLKRPTIICGRNCVSNSICLRDLYRWIYVISKWLKRKDSLF